MVNNTIGVFTAATSVPQWKTALSAKSGFNSAPAEVDHPKDTVSISPLGRVLTGTAADVFSRLDTKTRDALSGFVDSGKMSADEVSLGLRHMATGATFGRFTRERKKDDDDVALSMKQATADAAFMKQGKALENLGKNVDDVMKRYENNEISGDEMLKAMPDVRKEVSNIQAEHRNEIGGDPDAVQTGILNLNLSKNMQQFSSLGLDKSNQGLTSLDDAAGSAAAQKFIELGLSSGDFNDALEQYASEVDIPGIGRATQPANGRSPVEADAARGNGPTSASNANVARVPVDQGNGKAAISMLQSALGNITYGSNQSKIGALDKASDQPETGIATLMETLKAGGNPSSPSIKIDS